MFLLFDHALEKLIDLSETNSESLQVILSNDGLVGKVLVHGNTSNW
jgi:hypothetical protein